MTFQCTLNTRLIRKLLLLLPSLNNIFPFVKFLVRVKEVHKHHLTNYSYKLSRVILNLKMVLVGVFAMDQELMLEKTT